MVEFVTVVVAFGQPRMEGHDLPPVEDQQFVAPQQQHAHALADEAGRYRVMALADCDPAGPVGLRCQGDPAFECLERQGCQRLRLGSEVEADRGEPAVQDSVVLGGIDLGDPLVQLLQRVHLGDGHQVRAPVPAASCSTPPFSWAPSWPGMQ
ncbi:hypothetical protein OG507_39060 [Streptomyces sp. NBC_01217]|nr:hypothetical protein OG507_00510 [Streptomyces sp. NBC_01217]WSQ62515.1 hypothetical protein OG507_39060 [Streptomyces sp. NBC_01217]